jgi:hypothetical protein
MVLAERTTNLMQRLARLPKAPDVNTLRRRKPVPSALSHNHHLSHQMVLHRPVETARVLSNFTWPEGFGVSNLVKTPFLLAAREGGIVARSASMNISMITTPSST